MFGALADPTRRAIIERLSLEGEVSVADLAAPFAMTPRAVAKHVAVLEVAGLVTRRREAQRNLARINEEALGRAEQWLHAQRDVWAQRLSRLGVHLAASDRA